MMNKKELLRYFVTLLDFKGRIQITVICHPLLTVLYFLTGPYGMPEPRCHMWEFSKKISIHYFY